MFFAEGRYISGHPGTYSYGVASDSSVFHALPGHPEQSLSLLRVESIETTQETPARRLPKTGRNPPSTFPRFHAPTFPLSTRNARALFSQKALPLPRGRPGDKSFAVAERPAEGSRFPLCRRRGHRRPHPRPSYAPEFCRTNRWGSTHWSQRSESMSAGGQHALAALA